MSQNDCNLKSHPERTLGRHIKTAFFLWLLNCSYIIQETFQGRKVHTSPSCVPYLLEAGDFLVLCLKLHIKIRAEYFCCCHFPFQKILGFALYSSKNSGSRLLCPFTW